MYTPFRKAEGRGIALGLLPCLVVSMLGALAGCDRPDAEPAPQGALPDLGGTALGPQPGSDRPLPKLENPYGMEPNVLVEGRRLFVWFNCYGCHGGRGGGGMGPSLRDPTWRYGKAPEDIFASIAEGRSRGMPAWGTKLPEEQIWKITAYIESMGTASEPKPPPKNPTWQKPPPGRVVTVMGKGGG